MMICEVSQRSLKPFMVTVYELGGVGALQMVSGQPATVSCTSRRGSLSNHLAGQRHWMDH